MLQAALRCSSAAPRRRNVMNLLDNPQFIFNCPHAFTERFSGAEDFFTPKDEIEPDPVRGLAMRTTNLIPDVINCDLPLDNRRSPGYRRVEPQMASNRFYTFVGQHETGRYAKAHKHHSTAVLICIEGKGYTYTWPDALGTTPWRGRQSGQDLRQDYEPVGLVSAAPMAATGSTSISVPALALYDSSPGMVRTTIRPSSREGQARRWPISGPSTSKGGKCDSLSHGRPRDPRRIRKHAEAGGRRQPHEPGVLRTTAR